MSKFKMNTKNNSQDNWKEQVAELFPYLGIYQIRAVIDFISSLLSSREKEIEGLKKTENFQEDQSVSDEVYYEQQQNIGYNQAIDDVLKIIKK